MLRDYIDINHEVLEAIAFGKPVVALESTIIAHGMPYPMNVETAFSVNRAIRENDAIPAVIGIIKGRIKVGLSDEEIEYLGKAEKVMKVSRRDFPIVCAEELDGATTVAGTMIVAKAAGIRIFVTGGIGGVHRGAGESFDISADMEELKDTDVVVICAGVKSILDIGATLEYLETSGVPVISYGTDDFPAFYSRKSGFKTEYRVSSPEAAAAVIKTKFDMGLKGGMLIACPVPEEHEIPFETIDGIISKALDDCDKEGITGKRVTPYLLERVSELTSGQSLQANIQLVLNNAIIGTAISKSLI